MSDQDEKKSKWSFEAIWAVTKAGSVAGSIAFVGYLHAWLLYMIMLAIMSNVIPTIELRWWQLIKDRIEFVVDVTRCSRWPSPAEADRCMTKWAEKTGSGTFSPGDRQKSEPKKEE